MRGNVIESVYAVKRFFQQLSRNRKIFAEHNKKGTTTKPNTTTKSNDNDNEDEDKGYNDNRGYAASRKSPVDIIEFDTCAKSKRNFWTCNPNTRLISAAKQTDDQNG